MTLTIKTQFRDYLPPLTQSELDQLEASVLSEGIREPITLWNGVIIDGHHRYQLAQTHGLEFETADMYFPDEDAVLEWMIVNQIGRRNFEPQLKTLFIGKLYELRKKRVGNPASLKAKTEPDTAETPVKSNVVTVTTLKSPPQRTEEIIAKETGVSPITVRRAAKLHQAFESASPDVQDAFKRGEVSQKHVIESTKPTITDILDDDEKDDVTRLAKEYSARFTKLVKDFNSTVEEATSAFASKGKNFLTLSPDLALFKMDKVELAAWSFKRTIKCPACKGQGCKHCDSIGYIDSKKKEQILDRIDYIAKGGVTYDDIVAGG